MIHFIKDYNFFEFDNNYLIYSDMYNDFIVGKISMYSSAISLPYEFRLDYLRKTL